MSSRSGGTRQAPASAAVGGDGAKPRTLSKNGVPLGRPPSTTPPARRITIAGAVQATMRTQAARMASLSHERLIVVDRAGRVLHTVSGNRYKGGGGKSDTKHVAEAGLNKRVSGNFEMHNHHAGLFATFSLGDITNTIQARSLGTRVVSPDRTVTMYPRSDGTWPKVAEVRAAYKSFMDGTLRSMLNDARAGRMSNALYNVRAEDLLRSAWRHVAAQTGMRYVESPSLMPKTKTRARAGGR